MAAVKSSLFSPAASIHLKFVVHLTTVDSLRPLLGRTLVLVAHPDDEAVGCGVLLQRITDPIVVFATDGAPHAEYFWKPHGSREGYASVRRAEAEQALAAVGVDHFHWLCEQPGIADQELFLNLPRALRALSELVAAEMPDAILTHAYEGGHPDHDSCAFLGHLVSRILDVSVWEMPLYHRAGQGIRRQAFISDMGSFAATPASDELARKKKMLTAYRSQAQVIAEFLETSEVFRPMAAYDFTRAPHSGVPNYEAWQWPMTGEDLCRAFDDLQCSSNELARK